MKLTEVKFIHVPLYDELAVVRLWPLMTADKKFMQYMPSKLPKGRTIDRQYFWNVLNTVNEEYVSQIVAHANAQRNSTASKDQEAMAMEITDDWLEKLQAIPYISRKFTLMINPSVERRGRTVHLLRQKSKDVPQARKRRKIDLLSTP